MEPSPIEKWSSSYKISVAYLEGLGFNPKCLAFIQIGKISLDLFDCTYIPFSVVLSSSCCGRLCQVNYRRNTNFCSSSHSQIPNSSRAVLFVPPPLLHLNMGLTNVIIFLFLFEIQNSWSAWYHNHRRAFEGWKCSRAPNSTFSTNFQLFFTQAIRHQPWSAHTGTMCPSFTIRKLDAAINVVRSKDSSGTYDVPRAFFKAPARWLRQNFYSSSMCSSSKPSSQESGGKSLF